VISRAARRRRALLIWGAAAALLAGALVGARAEEPPIPQIEIPSGRPGLARLAEPAPEQQAAVDKLPLTRQVGKLVVLRFVGTSAPSFVRRVLHDGQAAGAILFRDNVTGPDQLRALTAALRKSGTAAGAMPIVCVDQEGGQIRIVSWAPPANPPAGQDPRPDARAAGRALRGLGINVALAPVADIPSVPGSAMESRALSRDPQRTASAVAQPIKGWRDAGVAPTVKHFPGLGATTVNTDRASATIGGNRPASSDLTPFKAAIDAGVPLVMSSNAVYPALDSRNLAAQSPAVLETLLRGKLGFKGVVMTDSIEAAAVRATGSTEQVAVRSIEAGNDVVLTTGQGSWNRVYRALLERAKASKAFRTRVRDSAARVLALQNSLR
jgi:beta-N-acetylhexosaminidase